MTELGVAIHGPSGKRKWKEDRYEIGPPDSGLEGANEDCGCGRSVLSQWNSTILGSPYLRAI